MYFNLPEKTLSNDDAKTLFCPWDDENIYLLSLHVNSPLKTEAAFRMARATLHISCLTAASLCSSFVFRDIASAIPGKNSILLSGRSEFSDGGSNGTQRDGPV
ncbi:long-chain-fatty-acid CoA ligase [Striga asiatica]|uniref:Long-chain-fatty-acid CoA ligase n=1 Tax=Striga asiatica TaxID=4170 RepID=A0A5A7QIW4_STRAF|nr:long-chain-fatty-acid CoA ligase [Striga asiatica]